MCLWLWPQAMTGMWSQKKKIPQLWELLTLVMTHGCLHNQNTHRALIEQPHYKCDEDRSSSRYDKFGIGMWFVPAVALCFQRCSNASRRVIKMFSLAARRCLICVQSINIYLPHAGSLCQLREGQAPAAFLLAEMKTCRRPLSCEGSLSFMVTVDTLS